MELTEEGRMFFGYVKGALKLIKNAEIEFSSFKDLSKGEIKRSIYINVDTSFFGGQGWIRTIVLV